MPGSSRRPALPAGFRVGTASFDFAPVEVPKPARMRLTLIALDQPTAAFAAKFTRNAFPGAPVIVGRRRLDEPALGAILVNNKISNVCAPGGVEAAERVCAEAARLVGCAPQEILPSSTGVIGWQLPVDEMLAALPAAAARSGRLGAARGRGHHDDRPLPEGAARARRRRQRRRHRQGRRHDRAEPRHDARLRPHRRRRAARDAAGGARAAVDASFNCISVDSDTSTSDTVVLLSSRRLPVPPTGAFDEALARVCGDLAEDVVRNGEGVRHVMRVAVSGARSFDEARALGKAVVNSPLFKAAVNGNDPNVGRLLCAAGKHVGALGIPLDPARVTMKVGGEIVLEAGALRLDPEKEQRLVRHLRAAELYASTPAADGMTFRPPVDYPPHERRVEIEIDLRMGGASCAVLGADLTHEYVTENADYRS